MDRSRRGGTGKARKGSEPGATVPTASRLTLRARKNRRRAGSVWSRLPSPCECADACGRAVRRAVPALAATAAITVVGSGVWAGHRFVTSSPRFAITTIEVRGEAHLTEDEVRAALPVAVGDNVFGTKLDTLTASVQTLPWVASASVHRELPHTLVVDIREHEPVAIVDLGVLYLVDPGGHPFKRARLDAGDGEGLPVITGLSRDSYQRDPAAAAGLVTEALDALATWRTPGTRPEIGEVHVDAHHALTLRTYDHATAIELGPVGPIATARMQTFDVAWAELTAAERPRLRAIHLGDRADLVTVALHPAPPSSPSLVDAKN